MSKNKNNANVKNKLPTLVIKMCICQLLSKHLIDIEKIRLKIFIHIRHKMENIDEAAVMQ